MTQDLVIVSDPDAPKLGDEVTLSVRVAGEAVSRTRRVDWEFQQRDGPQHPLDTQDAATVTIPAWCSDNHGTYYAVDPDTGQTAARTIPPALRVALSGGGYRATLFSLGALMYLVDVDAQHRIEDLTSVSGGSIANAIVLETCDLSTTTRDEFWNICRDVAAQITRARLRSRRRLVDGLRTGSLVVLGVGTPVFLWVSLGVVGLGVAAVLIAGAMMLRGWWVGHVLKRRFGLAGSLHEPRRRVSHIFCATDLVAGEPFFFLAMLSGGFFYSRRRGATRSGEYPVRKAVRASAAFPFAFLPKRVDLKRRPSEWEQQPGTDTAQYVGAIAFCADGGVANNLGTQWFEEQDPADWPYRLVFGSHLAEGVTWRPARETIDIAIDASIPIEPVSPRWFRVPLVAELRSVSRVMRVLYENTLRPRRIEATWADSVLEASGYAALVAERGAAVKRRGTHRRILVPLDAHLLRRTSELTHSEDLVFVPIEVVTRAFEVAETLSRLGVVADEDEPIVPLARAQRISTTLFRRSSGEVVAALMGGYLAALINCHAYEGLGIPANLADTVARIRSLG